MESYGYEIKAGKHIGFRSKNQQRFIRTKTIGVHYTEERIKDRILNKDKELGNIIDIKNHEKQSPAKVMNIGQPNIIFKQQLLHLLKSGIKVLIQLKN